MGHNPGLSLLVQELSGQNLLALEGDAGRAAQAVFTEPFWQAMIDSLPAVHARPNGVILLAENDGHAVGCGMLHPLSDRDAEIKRLFIAPEARGTGTGKRLTCALITHARQHGYARVMLDTTNGHVTAAGLYSSLGFTRRGPAVQIEADTRGLRSIDATFRQLACDKLGDYRGECRARMHHRHI